MVKIYGMPTCPYCDYIHEQIVGRENEFEYINIGENIRNMGAFTRLRDTNPAFDHSKEIGDVGIPAFVLEDGSITLDPAVVGLIEYVTLALLYKAAEEAENAGDKDQALDCYRMVYDLTADEDVGKRISGFSS